MEIEIACSASVAGLLIRRAAASAPAISVSSTGMAMENSELLDRPDSQPIDVPINTTATKFPIAPSTANILAFICVAPDLWTSMASTPCARRSRRPRERLPLASLPDRLPPFDGASVTSAHSYDA
ncbi:MAG TPA: hypothetical protein VF516_04165 [Kofleriaceae bacterium]